MSKLAYEIEPLNQVLDGHEIRKEDALRLLSNFEDTSDLVFKTSEKLRDRNKGRAVSFSKKSFFNIIILILVVIINIISYKVKSFQN